MAKLLPWRRQAGRRAHRRVGQRHRVGARLRRRHRLRAAADLALPRGAAPHAATGARRWRSRCAAPRRPSLASAGTVILALLTPARRACSRPTGPSASAAAIGVVVALLFGLRRAARRAGQPRRAGSSGRSCPAGRRRRPDEPGRLAPGRARRRPAPRQRSSPSPRSSSPSWPPACSARRSGWRRPSSSAPRSSPSPAQEPLARHFPAGRVAAGDGHRRRRPPTGPSRRPSGVDGVAAVAPAGGSDDGTLAKLDASTCGRVRHRGGRRRGAAHPRRPGRRYSGAGASSAGHRPRTSTSGSAYARDNMVVVPLVLLVVLLVLVLLLRSVVAPLLLLLTVVVSFAASVGAASLVLAARLRHPGARRRRAAAELPVPRGARRGLQHLPRHPGPGGGGRARRHPRRAMLRALGRHRRRHHVARASCSPRSSRCSGCCRSSC